MKKSVVALLLLLGYFSCSLLYDAVTPYVNLPIKPFLFSDRIERPEWYLYHFGEHLSKFFIVLSVYVYRDLEYLMYLLLILSIDFGMYLLTYDGYIISPGSYLSSYLSGNSFVLSLHVDYLFILSTVIIIALKVKSHTTKIKKS